MNHGLAATPFYRGFWPLSDLARRWRESFAPRVTLLPGPPPGLLVPPAPDSSEDLLEPLRRVTT